MNLGKIAVVAAGVALGVAACGSTSTGTSPGSTSTSSTTAPGPALYEEANVGVTFTQDFNPFDTASLAHGMNMTTLVYEPLYEMDALNPGSSGSHPWLASSYAFGTGGTTLAITVKSNVKFNDGSAMSANDVANT